MLKKQQTNFTNLAIVAMVLMVAFLLLLPTATADLPFIHHADEPTNLTVLHAMMADGTANPHFFNYPSLMFYLNAPGQYLAQALSDTPIALDIQAMGSVHAPASKTILFARMTSMLAHLATVASVLIFLLPRTGRMLAISAGLLVGLSPLVQSYSIWAAPDVFATFFVTICLLVSIRIVETGRSKLFIVAGAMAGLAAATKYNSGFVAIAIAVAAALAPGDGSERARLVARAALVSIVALFIGSPFLFLDHNSAILGFLFELEHYKNGHAGAEGFALWFNAARMVSGLGIAILLMLPACRRRELWPVLVFIVGYFLFLSIQTVRFERNLAPLVPAVSLLAAISIADLRQRYGNVIAFILTIAIALPTLPTVMRWFEGNQISAASDRAWLESAVPSDANVVVESYAPFLQSDGRKINAVKFAFLDSWAEFEPTHLVLSRSASQRFHDDPSTRQAYTSWIQELTTAACEINAYPSEKNWTSKVFGFDCN